MDAQKIIYMKFSKTKIKLTHLTWWSSLYFELVREGFIGGVGDWKDQIEMFQKSSSDPQTTSSLKVMVYIHIYSGLWIFIESFKTLVLYVCVYMYAYTHKHKSGFSRPGRRYKLLWGWKHSDSLFGLITVL